MRKIAALSVLLTMCVASIGQAATVRGLVLRRGNPAPFATIVLVGRLGRSAPATTGADGMYYFVNVPADCYTLEVWLGTAQQATASFPNSCVTEPHTDIPPVRVE